MRVELEGARNFRDLGGIPTVDGKVVRTGLVYRADALHALTDADRGTLQELGLRTAFDLRSDMERETEPTAAPWLDVVHVPLVDPGNRVDIRQVPDGETFLVELYQRILRDAAGRIGSIVAAVADGACLPAVVHCSAGKDRTGLVSATILLAVGVDREIALDDYEATSQYQAARRVERIAARLEEAGLPAELAAGLMGTPRHAMELAIDSVIERHGSIEGYLDEAAGVDRATVAALRQRLVG